MREYLVTVLLAAIITYLVTPLVRDLAVKAGDFHNQYQKRNCDFLLQDYTKT